MSDLAENFTFEDHGVTWPFIEDEDCNITGYGHQDPEDFASAINRYDEACTGTPVELDDLWDADYIGHYWVTLADDGEHLLRCTQDEPGAFPVTGLWGQR